MISVLCRYLNISVYTFFHDCVDLHYAGSSPTRKTTCYYQFTSPPTALHTRPRQNLFTCTTTCPHGRGTVVSIVSCRCPYCCLETSHGKITRHYSRFCTVAFFHVHKGELSYMCPGHDIKLHPHQVKLYRIRCVGSSLVLVKELT